VVVGRVTRVRLPPHGKRIGLADVDIGGEYLLQIVWGDAPIVEEGDLVPVARPGAWLPATKDKHDRYKIRRRHYRGELSEGMLCSPAELGWDPSVADRVARLNGSAGLCPGDSLDDVGESWPLILRPEDEFRAEVIYAALESPKKAVILT
jgi:tRNA-binding EMAP/Myf-like protein